MKLPDFQEFDAFNSLRASMHADLVDDLSPVIIKPLVLLPDPPAPPPKPEPVPEPQFIGIDKRIIMQLAEEERAYIAAHTSPIAKEIPDMGLLDMVQDASVHMRIEVPEEVVVEPVIEEKPAEVIPEPEVKAPSEPKVYRKASPKVFRPPRKRLLSNVSFKVSLPDLRKQLVATVSVLLGAVVVTAGLYYVVDWYSQLPEPVKIAAPKPPARVQQNTAAPKPQEPAAQKEVAQQPDVVPTPIQPDPVIEHAAPEPIQQAAPEPVYEPAAQIQTAQQPIIPDMAAPPPITQPQREQPAAAPAPSRARPSQYNSGASRSAITAAGPSYDGGFLGVSDGVLAAGANGVADENASELRELMKARKSRNKHTDTPVPGMPDFDAIIRSGGNVKQALDDYAKDLDRASRGSREAKKRVVRSNRGHKRINVRGR